MTELFETTGPDRPGATKRQDRPINLYYGRLAAATAASRAPLEPESPPDLCDRQE